MRTIAAHADSLLRTARRHSICVDDAQDAYQRAIEIFMGHAPRLDPVRAPGWLHVVVKREAQALRREREKLVTSTEINLDGQEADSLPTPEERLLSFDMVSRSAEALKRLKPHELRALWLRGQGHSYSDIAALTGWSYTKVNRCVSEGRRSFLEHYEGIESGDECRRWLPVLSALVDGEASPEQLVALRPHLRNCPGCRATLKALQDSGTPLAALLPVPLVAVAGGGIGDHVAQAAVRLYEAVAGGLHERAVHSFTKAQALVEASAAGKLAAVAASAAAVAGGGYATVERVVEKPTPARRASVAQTPSASRPAARDASWNVASVRAASVTSKTASSTASLTKRTVLGGAQGSRRLRWAPEFRPQLHARPAPARYAFGAQAAAARVTSTSSSAPRAARQFAPRGPSEAFTP